MSDQTTFTKLDPSKPWEEQAMFKPRRLSTKKKAMVKRVKPGVFVLPDKQK